MQGNVRSQAMPVLMGMLCVLIALDGYSSVHGAAVAGKHELNPFILFLSRHLSFGLSIALVKLLDLITVLVFYRIWQRRASSLWINVVAVINVFYTLVIIHNFS